MFDATDKARAQAKLRPLDNLPPTVERISWASPAGCRSTVHHDHAERVRMAQVAQRVGRVECPPCATP
jgi:hypothetical protein